FARPSGNAPPARITATLVDGREIVCQVDDMPGFPGKPMTRAEVERKFLANIGTRWPAHRTAEILQALWALDRTDDLRGLLEKMSLLTYPGLSGTRNPGRTRNIADPVKSSRSSLCSIRANLCLTSSPASAGSA